MSEICIQIWFRRDKVIGLCERSDILDKSKLVSTIRNKLLEIKDKGYQVIIPMNFDFEILSELSKCSDLFSFFEDDLLDPIQHLKKLESKSPQELFSYLLQITQTGSKSLLLTQWFYCFIHNNFKHLSDALPKVALLHNNGKSYAKKNDDEDIIPYDQHYSLNEVDQKSFSNYFLFSEMAFINCSSSKRLYDLLNMQAIFSINTTTKLKDRLSDAGFTFVGKVEQSTLQLFDKLTNDVKLRLRELSALEEPSFKLNPVYFDGYLPNEEVLNMPLEAVLKDVFKHDAFRKFKKYNKEGKNKEIIGQEELIRFLLEQSMNGNQALRDLFFVSGTGSGKSLIFQMAAYILKKKYNKMTLVVSPLKALMKDQKDSTNEVNLNVEYDNSDLSYEEQANLRERIGKGEIDLIYVSPEKLTQAGNYYLSNGCDIGLMVIDETHLVSTWGKTFRVDYGYLGEMIRSINKKRTFPIFATTATSVWGGSLDTVGEIIDLLNLKDPLIIMTDFLRKNITIEISHSAGERDDSQTEKLIKSTIDNNEKAVVYTSYAKDARAIVEDFKDKFPEKRNKVGLYTGKQKIEEKNMNQNSFKNGRMNTIVATKAFGMGIDVQDIKTVYHHDLPSNLSEYMQEIGRAGRNGDQAFARTHFTGDSVQKSSLLSRLSLPPMWIAEKIFQHVAQRVKDVKGTEDFTISLEDIMYLFINAQKKEIDFSDALQKARVAMFLLQKDLEYRYRKPLLYRKSESYQYLYFTADEATGEKIIETNKDIVRFFRNRPVRSTPNGGIIADRGPIYSVDITKLWETGNKNFTIRSLVYRFFNESHAFFPGHTIYPLIFAQLEMHTNTETIERTFFKLLEIAEEFCQTSYGYKSEKELEQFIEPRIKGIDGLYNMKREIMAIFKNQFGTSQNHHAEKFLFVCTDDEKTKFKRLTAVPRLRQWRSKLTEILAKQQNHHHIEYFFHPNVQLVKPVLNILDILNLAKVNYHGGKNTILTMRCADTHARKILLSLSSKDYKCLLIKSIKAKQKKEMEIATNFYKAELNNAQRWDYLERYFLGEEIV